MTASGLRHYQIQLTDLQQQAIITAGGFAYVCTQDTAKKAAIKDANGASAANPVIPTRGNIEFWTLAAVQTVDLYVMTPGGQFLVAKAITASGPNTLRTDLTRRDQVAVIPFSYADVSADAAETTSGIDLPTNALVKSQGVAAYVSVLDATETITAGILSTQVGGDQNGFMDLLPLDTAKTVAPQNTITAGTSETYFASTTIGALIQDFTAGSDVNKDVGTVNPKVYRIDGVAKTVSWTLSAGSDTAQGFLLIPYDIGVV